MKISLAICNKYKNGNLMMAFLVTIIALIYVINEYYRIIIDLPFVGFTRCFPFFTLGYWCKQKGLIVESYQKSDWAICMGGLLISMIFFYKEFHGILEYATCFWIICF